VLTFAFFPYALILFAFAGHPNLQAAFVVSCVPALCSAKRPTNELKKTQILQSL
jgi:hypothetical protein